MQGHCRPGSVPLPGKFPAERSSAHASLMEAEPAGGRPQADERRAVRV